MNPFNLVSGGHNTASLSYYSLANHTDAIESVIAACIVLFVDLRKISIVQQLQRGRGAEAYTYRICVTGDIRTSNGRWSAVFQAKTGFDRRRIIHASKNSPDTFNFMKTERDGTILYSRVILRPDLRIEKIVEYLNK